MAAARRGRAPGPPSGAERLRSAPAAARPARSAGPRDLGYDAPMLWLLGCPDYQVTPEEVPPEPGDLVVTPTALDLEGVCEGASRDVVLQNRGESPLTLSGVALDADNWSVSYPSLPVEIAPGRAINLTLTGSAGQGTLTVTTDDPDTPTVVVPLAATANVAPTVYITAPYEDQVLDPDAPFTLAGVVADPESPPETLVAEWRSNRLGHLVTTAPDSDGRVVTAWPDELRRPGPVVVELVLTDPCGATGEMSMYACQDGAWEVESLAADVWQTEGDAVVDQPSATAALGPGAGAGFDAYLTFDAELFAAEFDVAGAGAGFTLTLLDPERATDWLGGDGCGLGLGPDTCTGPGLPGWAVVFDTQAGDGNDCGAAPSLSLVIDGELDAPLACAPLPAGFAGGHVRVTSAAGAVHVEIDGVAALDAALPAGVAGTAYAGFTGVGDWIVNELVLTDSQCDPA